MAAASSAAFQLRLLGRRFRLIGPSEEIGPLKEALYARCQEPPGGPADCIWRLEVCDEGYVVRDAGREAPPLFRSKDRTEVFWWLDRKIFNAALEGADDMLQIHGAALARDGEGVLLVGGSESGKSTLTLHLVRSGFRFFSDEVILLEPDSFRLRPFPRNVMFREGTVRTDELLAPFGETPWEYQHEMYEDIWFFDPARIGAREIGGDAGVGEIICLERKKKGRAVLEPLGVRRTVEFLLEQQINLQALGERGVDAIIRLASQGPGSLLRSVHAGEAWPLLRAHLNLPPD